MVRRRGRLIAWLALVGFLAFLAYVARLGGAETPEDVAYQYSSSIAALVQYGLMLAILLLIARGLPRRQVFALVPPASWGRAIGFAGLALLGIYLAAFVYDRLLSLLGDWNATDEQGLVPKDWDSSRAGAFIAFFLVVTLVAPAIEELTYRGLGISLLLPYGVVAAVLVSGVLFGAAHGLLVGLPILAFFGVVVGWLRARTMSIYPPMLLHATFNGTALVISVTVA